MKKYLEKFEMNYLLWTLDDVILWLKAVHNLQFLIINETNVTLMPLVQKLKTTGKTMKKHLNYENPLLSWTETFSLEKLQSTVR